RPGGTAAPASARISPRASGTKRDGLRHQGIHRDPGIAYQKFCRAGRRIRRQMRVVAAHEHAHPDQPALPGGRLTDSGAVSGTTQTAAERLGVAPAGWTTSASTTGTAHRYPSYRCAVLTFRAGFGVAMDGSWRQRCPPRGSGAVTPRMVGGS